MEMLGEEKEMAFELREIEEYDQPIFFYSVSENF